MLIKFQATSTLEIYQNITIKITFFSEKDKIIYIIFLLSDILDVITANYSNIYYLYKEVI